jgi:hypothetical protein
LFGQTHRGGCNFWKWEDVYEDNLKKIGEICQDQDNASSSMNQISGRSKKGKMEIVTGGKIKNERPLMEIVLLLKLVIFYLGVIVCLMLVVVCKQCVVGLVWYSLCVLLLLLNMTDYE